MRGDVWGQRLLLLLQNRAASNAASSPDATLHAWHKQSYGSTVQQPLAAWQRTLPLLCSPLAVDVPHAGAHHLQGGALLATDEVQLIHQEQRHSLKGQQQPRGGVKGQL